MACKGPFQLKPLYDGMVLQHREAVPWLQGGSAKAAETRCRSCRGHQRATDPRQGASAVSLSQASAWHVPKPATAEPAAIPSQASACCQLCSPHPLLPTTNRGHSPAQDGCSARFGASGVQGQPTALWGML